MLQATVARLDGVANLAKKTIVVCNDAHRFLVAQQLGDLGVQADILLEPEGRNTAPAIALAALHAVGTNARSASAPVLLVMPADHVIEDNRSFREAINEAVIAAEDGNLVTLGIKPSSPNTGFGYIEADTAGKSAVQVTSFVEKPDLETASAYVQGGRHFWNSGIFVFRADKYLHELHDLAPEIYRACRAAMNEAQADTDFTRPDTDAFLTSPADSIDYAVMEKADKVMMVPLDAGWNDVGSWSALHDVSARDERGNAISGDVVLHDCSDSYVSSESRLVTAVGVDNLIIVETKDSILVASRDKSQDVKHLVEQLKADGRAETTLHRQVFRPWGSYDGIDAGEGFQVKRLIVNPGAVLSLQMHHRRAEHWVVVRGTATITLNDDVFDLTVNQSTHIPIGATHRIANNGSVPVHIIEVQCGDYLGEDDIVRFEDNYGRQGTNT